jgi:peptidoglycan/xylan/chitin deacetylase (PgdA/CDA1 family)
VTSDEALQKRERMSFAPGVPILMYHQITAPPAAHYPRYTVTPARFTRQIRWLALRGYSTISLDTYLRCRAGEEPWPRHPIVITFDDGYEEAMQHALDTLPRFGFRATVFLVAGAIGRTSDWDAGVSMPVAGWSRLRELVSAGFECGSHTLTHPRLADAPPGACMRELRDSRRQLEDGLGVPIRHVSYPYGSVDAHVRALASEAGYASGCSSTLELAAPQHDPMLLPRVLMVSSDSLADFVCRLRTARPLAEMVRARLRRMIG